ncbi:MAG TPA: hypothetical protein VNL74_13140 [Methylococcus sp.]|nr:hypothetical protein [Methylococcus sp.]
MKIKGAFVSSVPDFAKGKLRYVEKPKHQRKELEIAVKIGIGDLIGTADTARDAVILAKFPDQTECELEFHHFEDSATRAVYKLRLKEKAGSLNLKDGSCDPSIVPSFVGQGPIVIEYDDDDDLGTPNHQLGTGNF